MINPEDMTYEDLKTAVEGWTTRPCATVCLPLRPGIFNPLLLPISPLAEDENEKVHWFDYIENYEGEVNIPALQAAYKKAMETKSWDDMPEPFGFKEAGVVPLDCKMQIAVVGTNEGKHFIVKQCIFKGKLKPSIFKRLCFGKLHKLNFTHPKIGVNVWQYVFTNLAGHLLLCYELSPEACKKEGGD